MARHKVTIVAPPDAGAQPGTTLLIPFESNALVSVFVEELFKRVQRQGLHLAPNTHLATLHLDSETGAILDIEDVLGDVADANDKLFAVFKKNLASGAASAAGSSRQSSSAWPLQHEDGGSQLKVRVITPGLAREERSQIHPITVPASSTVQQLREIIVEHLALSEVAATNQDLENECDCALARKLAPDILSNKHFFVVRGKSHISKFDLPPIVTKSTLTAALKSHVGEDITTLKKVTLHETAERRPVGHNRTAVVDNDDEDSDDGSIQDDAWSSIQSIVTSSHVAAICSKTRHTPPMAKATVDEGREPYKRHLDLHTSELPINQACSTSKLSEIGLDTLAIDDVVDIFAVSRAVAGDGTIISGPGKGTIFRDTFTGSHK